jgi:hypothetical protein
MLGTLLRNGNQERQWGSGAIPELGDMVFWENRHHSGVIAEKTGANANQIVVVQASYSSGYIKTMSLEDWQLGQGNSWFGHPKLP